MNVILQTQINVSNSVKTLLDLITVLVVLGTN